MDKEEVIDWIYNLPVQTLTDELKDDIVKKIDNLNQNKDDEDDISSMLYGVDNNQ